MSKLMYKPDASYVSCRDANYHYRRRFPYDEKQQSAAKMLSFRNWKCLQAGVFNEASLSLFLNRSRP